MKSPYLLFILFLFSCVQSPVPENVSGDILPVSKGVFYCDEPVTLKTNSLSEELSWYSSLQGELGIGGALSLYLRAGEHIITLFSGEIPLDQITLNIKEPEYVPGSSRNVLLYKEENSVYLPKGVYSPVIYSLSEESFTLNSSRGISGQRSVLYKAEAGSFLNLKSFSLKQRALSSLPVQNINRTVHSGVREFLVADTTGKESEGIRVEAHLYRNSERIDLWVDSEALYSSETLDSFFEEAQRVVLPRVLSLWGEWADRDQNGKISVLMSQHINEQEKAIGFFNSGDMHRLNRDRGSLEYNPVSNGMDIIYLAVPDETVFAYSKASLLATFAHEMAHLINYSSKVIFNEESSGRRGEREDLFLDEGLAHLTESLTGYGVAGGNMAFFARYLEEPGRYSLQGPDLYGFEDSIGKRGMNAAFLSWLFWREGGGEWSCEIPGIIYDRGGIEFLRKLLFSGYTGMENLNYCLKGETGTLFKEWVRWMDHQEREITHEIIVDPVTEDLVNLPPAAGEIISGGIAYNIPGPQRVDLRDGGVILPWSAVYYLPVEIEISGEYWIQGPARGQVLASFHMY